MYGYGVFIMNDKIMTFAMMLGIVLPVCAAVYTAKYNPIPGYYWGYYPMKIYNPYNPFNYRRW